MYVMRALVGSVALALVAAVGVVVSLTGGWFSAEGEQVWRWAAGAVGIAAAVGAVAQYREWEARRRWVARSTPR